MDEKIKNSDFVEQNADCSMDAGRLNKPQTAYVLIGLGLIFLLMQSSVLSHIFNWWALFMVVPGVIGLYQAYEGYQASGVWNQSRVVGSGLLTALGASFLIDLPMGFVWGTVWPLGLIALGVWMVRQRTAHS